MGLRRYSCPPSQFSNSRSALTLPPITYRYQPGRTALRDMILPGGYKLKKGSVLILALHHLHMNSHVWTSPDNFDPDRWDTESVKNRHKAAYVP